MIPILTTPYISGVDFPGWYRGHRFRHPALPQSPRDNPGVWPHLHLPHGHQLQHRAGQVPGGAGSGGLHHQELGGPDLCPELVVRVGHPPQTRGEPDEHAVRPGAHATGGLADPDDPEHPGGLERQEVGKRGNLPPGYRGRPDLQDKPAVASYLHGPGISMDAGVSGRLRPALQHPVKLQAGAARPIR